MDLNEDSAVIRVVVGSPAATAGILVGDVVTAVDALEVGGQHCTDVMDMSKTSYIFHVARCKRSAAEMQALTQDVMDTIKLRSVVEAGTETGVKYRFFEGRRLEDGRPDHLVGLQAWTLADVDSTLKRSMMGSGGGERKPIPRTALFDEIDAAVNAKHGAEAAPPAAAAPPALTQTGETPAFQLELPVMLSSNPADGPWPLAPLACDRAACRTASLGPASLGTLDAAISAAADPTAGSVAVSPDRNVQLLQQIGQGTYGAVWRATYKGEVAAVKILPLNDVPAAEVAAEIRLLLQCTCEHIVDYFDAFERSVNGRTALWVCMGYCELGSVLDLCAPPPRSTGG